MTEQAEPKAPKPSGRARRNGFLLLGAAILVGGLAWAAYAFVFAADRETTDDAYVAGDIVQVNSEIAGTVIGLHADDTQRVKTGELLIDLDPADAEIGLQSAEAGLAQAVRSVKALLAQADQLRAQITVRETDLRRARDDAQRRAALIASGAISREEFAHAKDTSDSQVAAVQAARAQLEETEARIGNSTVATHPDVLTAEARVRNAALALRRTKIRAPVDGIVAKRTVQVGQRVEPGSPLMSLVPLENIWIDANFKEVQLRRMRVGQHVEVTSDLYGGKVTYDGVVAGLSAGSGNAFALLPAQNATGNWIKIVQRVPVRILLDPTQLAAHPLRVGLSTAVTVFVQDGSGQPVDAVRSKPFPLKPSVGDDPEVESLISRIVAENGGGTSPSTVSAGQ